MIGAAVRRLVGADRAKPAATPLLPQLDREALEQPIAAAHKRSDAANRDHEASMARVAEVAEQIREAEAAFDADGSDELADRIVQLKRELERRQLFSQRTQRAAVTADGEHAQALATRKAAIAEHLKGRMTSIDERIRELWEQEGATAVDGLARFSEKLEALLDDARIATHEAGALGILDQPAWAQIRGLDGLRGAVNVWINERLLREFGPSVRMKVERFFG